LRGAHRRHYIAGVDPLLPALGERLRELRERRGLTLQKLARKSRLSVRFLSELLAGRANVSVVRLARVAEALGTSAAAVLAEAESSARGTGTAPLVVSLLGIRGAGKTAIGERLAERLGVSFVELDRQIEAEAGLSLAEIFALHGEAYYRRLEVVALKSVLDEGRSAIVAVGGGIVTNPRAMDLLDRQTITVWLRASFEDHWQRVVRQGDPRPMAGRPAAQAELKKLIAEREPLYRRASFRVDTSRLGLEESVDTLVERLSARPVVSGRRGR
jgi:XRE family aerobic/anaerobic benzoate catabolism transcriptional regulator